MLLPPTRLGFALRKLLYGLMGYVIDPSIPSAEVCAEFERSMTEFDANLAWASRDALNTVLAFAESASPDPTVQAAIDQVRADMEPPPAPTP